MPKPAWMDFLMGSGALKKAAATGDAPKTEKPEPVPNYVEQEIARQKKPKPEDAAPVEDKKKKQPRAGFRPAGMDAK